MDVIQTAASHTPHTQMLLDKGYCILSDILPAPLVDTLARDLDASFEQTPRARGPFYGNDTIRFGSLLNRSPHVAPFVQHGLILSIVQDILGPWCDGIALNLTQAIELVPNSVEQVPHRDQDMWPCSRLISPELHVEFLVNVMWPFVSYTRDNGATRIWPGSNHRQDEALMDPAGAISAEMEPGSALLFLGSTLHAGGANRTNLPRRGMIVSYTLGWLKPYELQWLSYPPEIARHFSPELAALIGYQIHRPNLGNYEGQCPSHLLQADRLDVSGAIDALGPDQIRQIEAFHAGALADRAVGSRHADAPP